MLRAATMVGAGALAYHAGRSAQQDRDLDAYQDEQLRDLQEQQRHMAQPQPTYPHSPSAGLSPEAIAKLEQLAQLRERGILSNDEFDAQKKSILSG